MCGGGGGGVARGLCVCIIVLIELAVAGRMVAIITVVTSV